MANSGFPDDYPNGSLQRDLYNWARRKGHMDMGKSSESGAEFITRISAAHPEEFAVFVAQRKMGALSGK